MSDSKRHLSNIKNTSTKIKVISTKKNLGVSQARNLGASHASGNLIAFLDSDDIWKRDKLTMQVDFMNKNKIDVVSYTWCRSRLINSESEIIFYDYNELLNSSVKLISFIKKKYFR